MSTDRQRVVYYDEGVEPPEGSVEFRLTYEGKLLSTRAWVEPAPCEKCGHAPAPPTDSKAEHKHELRKHFHKQLWQLWRDHPQRRQMFQPITLSDDRESTFAEEIATEFKQNNFRWLPLVRVSPVVHCSLDILYLRRGARGAVLDGADLDNRVKTIMDALKIPKLTELDASAMPDLNATPSEDPFYVLLEDDTAVSRLIVESDNLLDHTNPDLGGADSRVVITVKTWTEPV